YRTRSICSGPSIITTDFIDLYFYFYIIEFFIYFLGQQRRWLLFLDESSDVYSSDLETRETRAVAADRAADCHVVAERRGAANLEDRKSVGEGRKRVDGRDLLGGGEIIAIQ